MGRKRRQRSRREILADALAALSGGPLNRFMLKARSELSAPSLEKFLEDWLAWGLVEWVEEPGYGAQLGATEKGLKWLRHWRYLDSLMKGQEI
jgi:predicted transcriptional regulator